jgi:tRNA-dihydrouridine synthase
MEPYTANPILRELMARNGAQLLFRPKIIPFHFLKSPEWQIYEKIKDIKTLTTPNNDPVYDGIQLLPRPDDPLKQTIQQINENAEEYGIDWIDLNFACPGHKVRPQNRGGELLQYPEKIEQIIEKVLKYSKLPISIKIRRGYTINEPAAELCSRLKQYDLIFITINRAPVSFGERKVKEILHDYSPFEKALERIDGKIPIIANGQLNPHLEEVKQGIRGCIGCMVGTDALGNPTIFSSQSPQSPYNIQIEFEHLFSIIKRYCVGDSGRWTTIGPLKQLLFFYIKYYYISTHQQLPPGYGITKWNKTHFSKLDFIENLHKIIPIIPKSSFETWLDYLN